MRIEPIIEKGIPLPRPRGRANTGMTEALDRLKVKESFAIGKVSPKGTRNLGYRLAPKVFSVRLDETGAYRVWRVE